MSDLTNKIRQIWAIITGHTLGENVTAFDDLIQNWWSVYRGDPSWLDYSYATLGGNKQKRTRKEMNAAKIVCSELAGLCFTETPELTTDKDITDFLNREHFWEHMTEYAEYGAALGGFALKFYADATGPHIDYVTADCFVPVSWNSARITEAGFISKMVHDGKKILRVEHHKKATWKDEQGKDVCGYEISSDFYDDAQGTWTRTDAQHAGQEAVVTRIATDTPLFVYIKTPEANNKTLDSPLGISIFANAMDTLESLDIAFDALQLEITLGKRRIIVPSQCVRAVIDTKTGKPVQYFDPADETFIAFNSTDAKEMKITDNTVEIRTESIKGAIQALLSILSVQVGFSAGYLNFDGTSMKTATEVVSENSKTFKTKTAYENNIGSGILQLLETIRTLGSLYGINTTSAKYTIAWDDDVIEDRNARATYWINRYTAGTVSLVKLLMKLDGMSKEEAQKEADAIKAEKATIDAGSMFGMDTGATA